MYNDFYKNKKVFLTGHSGFKGSWLCEILLKLGADVCGYSSICETEPNLYDLLDLNSRVKAINGDIRDYDKLFKSMKKFKPDIVIHFAAQPIVRESYKKPRYTYETNVMGTVNVLECVRNLSCVKSCLIITTDKVYHNKEIDYGYKETDELCGLDPYSNSKSCAELVYYSYYNSFFKDNKNISISTARSGNVIGGGDFSKDRIMSDAVKAYLNNEDLIVRNPHSIRPYQHVLDTLDGYLLLNMLMYNDKSIEGSYNFGPETASCVTTGELVTLFCNEAKEISWINKSEKDAPKEANFLKLDTTKAKEVLKWYPKWNIEKAVKEIVSFARVYKNNLDIKKEIEREIEEFYGRR